MWFGTVACNVTTLLNFFLKISFVALSGCRFDSIHTVDNWNIAVYPQKSLDVGIGSDFELPLYLIQRFALSSSSNQALGHQDTAVDTNPSDSLNSAVPLCFVEDWLAGFEADRAGFTSQGKQ